MASWSRAACCKSAKSFYQVSRTELASSPGVGVECGMAAAAGLGPTEPKYGSKKQREHINVTARET
jgi:hypothetical protein